MLQESKEDLISQLFYHPHFSLCMIIAWLRFSFHFNFKICLECSSCTKYSSKFGESGQIAKIHKSRLQKSFSLPFFPTFLHSPIHILSESKVSDTHLLFIANRVPDTSCILIILRLTGPRYKVLKACQTGLKITSEVRVYLFIKP